MPSTVIKIENLSKYYRLGLIGGGTLREDIDRWIAKIRGKPDPLLKLGEQDYGNRKGGQIWALKDINLEIKEGEILGIIGRNGAGKSTLLKILSKITAPTEGNIKINGRVGSLLEVGTGFHPELTGRENIYLNGTILGMNRMEVSSKLDEIVAFAEMDKFIDTPVKRYSSGMTVRLAFSVAAHLEPEILVVDEVLAVGDAAFQKKCLNKMQDVAGHGRTIIFVSHQMASVENLCTRCVVLNAGKIIFEGGTQDAIGVYLQGNEVNSRERELPGNIKRSGTGEIILTGFCTEDSKGNQIPAVGSGKTVVFAFDYRLNSKNIIKNVSIGFSIHNKLGDVISILYSDFSGITFSDLPECGTLRCSINDFPFSVGRYGIGVRLMVGRTEADWPQGQIGSIDVQAGDFYGTGNTSHSGIGPVLLRGDWHI